MHPEYYNNLRQKKLSLDDMQNEFYEIIKEFLNKDNERYFVEIEALLLTLFQNFISEIKSFDKIFVYNRTTSKNELKITSKISNQLLLQYYSTGGHGFSRIFELSLEYFLKKIELTEHFKV